MKSESYSFRLKSKSEHNQWLEEYLTNLGNFENKSQKLSALFCEMIDTRLEKTVQVNSVYIDTDEEDRLYNRLLERIIRELTKDGNRIQMIADANEQIQNGNEITDDVIDNIIQGFR